MSNVTPTTDKHLVLVGPKGRRAGLEGGWKVALQMAALESHAKQPLKGIASLLIPRTQKEKKRITNLIARGYSFKEVSRRETIRKSIRKAAISDSLVAQLLNFYWEETGLKHRYRSALKREFTLWVTKKLSELGPNRVKSVVGRAHTELLNRTSSDWWKKQLNQRLRK
jgi:hypothetical protein